MHSVKKTSEFESVVSNSKLPVLVYFSAPWCAHCKSLKTVLEDIDQNYTDSVNVVSVDVDHLPNITAKFNIRSIPTLLLFNEGVLIDSTIGPKTKEKVMEMIGVKEKPC